jgi:hypothetical protein
MLPQKIGRYEIKAELGRGGMATVYRAFDPRFKRDVAIKVLPREFLHDPQFRIRFEREAQTIAALEHSAIVPVYDFGEDAESGQLYIVMRLMTGGSLADRLERGPIPLLEAARIFHQLASALDKAHAKGIIHRDLKPGNILFDADDNPYIADFGIVKLTEATATFTGSGVVGTPAYMSPEQARGERGLDGRSDIYTLGAILFQMLTGKLPYEADTPMGIAIKHITEPPPHILESKPDLPPACEGLIQKAMAKNRDERFSTANGLAEALTTMAAGTPIRAAAPAPTVRIQPALRLRRWRWVIVAVIGLATLTLGAALWLGRSSDRQVAGGLGIPTTVFAQATLTVAPTRVPITPPMQTPTSTATELSTATSIPTIRPTRTPIPKPAWVTDFAEPILAAIAKRTPDFQDNFSKRIAGWTLSGWCDASRAKYVDGTLVITPLQGCDMNLKNLWYSDFVAEVEGKCLSGDPKNSYWSLGFRLTENADDKVGFQCYGWLWGHSDYNSEVRGLPPGSTNRLLVIAKGSQVAFYVNDNPAFFWTNAAPRRGIFNLNVWSSQWGTDTAVSFDNFKVWDISDISLEATPTP